MLVIQTRAETTNLGMQMDKMAADFKAIQMNLNDPSKNAESLAASQDLEVYAYTSFNLIPATISAADLAARPAMILQYKNLMSKLLNLNVQLSQAFMANKNTDAKNIFGQMGAVIQQGHTLFKPPQPQP